MFSLKEYREPKDRMPDYLPWALCVSDTTVLQKDGMLLRCWRFVGPDLTVSSPYEQIALADRVNAALARLGTGWGVWVEFARHPTDDYPDAEFTHLAAKIVDLEARSVFTQTDGVHQSEYYLSLGWMSPTDRASSVGDMFYAKQDDDEDEDAARKSDLAYFGRVCTEVAGMLSQAFLTFEALRGDDLMTYLHSCVSTQRQAVAMPDCPVYLDAYLPDEAFTPGEVSLLGDQCLAMFTIRGFPKRTPFGMLDKLCHLGIEFRWMTRFLPLDRAHAESVISRYQKRYWTSRKSLAKYGSELVAGEESALQNPIAKAKAEEAEGALRWLGSGEVAFGYFTSTFVVWDRDPKKAADKADALKKVVQDAKLVTVDETMNGLQAWLGTIPGHTLANVRRPLLHTKNLVRMMPIMSTYPGQAENGHLKRVTGVGTPHVVCLSGTSRFDLSLAVGDVGHTLIVGPSGSGKTTVAGYLELNWLKYPRAKVIIYDVGRGARATTLAVGGAYYTPGAPDGGCAFQPLRGVDREAERIWAAQWLLEILALRGFASHEIELAVEAVLHSMAANSDPRSRTMSEFVRLLGTHHEQLGDAMRIYTLQGLFGRIFDGDNDPLGDSFWRCYEMHDMMKLKDRQDVFVPVLKYLSHRDEEMVDGSPILKVKDECWRFWSDPSMAEDSRADVKTGRVHNTYNVYLTQELADFAADERLRSTMITNTQTHIYLANPKAKVPVQAQYYADIGLTPTEIALIAAATPARDYYYRTELLGRRWFSLPIGPAALAFIGGNDDNAQRAMDAIVRERDPQDYALALLELQASRPHGRDAQWAVDAIKTLRGDVHAAA